MRGCGGAAQRGACCVHSCHRIRRCGGAGNCRVKHNRGSCRLYELFALPWLVFVLPYYAYARWRCAGAAALLSGARAACTAATGFAGVAALAIAEISTTEALAARVIRLLRRGLFSCGPTVLMRDRDARVRVRVAVALLPDWYFSTAAPASGQLNYLTTRQMQLATVPKLLPPPKMSRGMPHTAARKVQGATAGRNGAAGRSSPYVTIC
jgi:hypothetical protein